MLRAIERLLTDGAGWADVDQKVGGRLLGAAPARALLQLADTCDLRQPRRSDLLGILVRGRVNGWLPALVVVVALWALVVGLIYLRTRAYLLVDGSRLTVRRFRKFHTVDAADLIAVAEFVTPNGPSYRLTVRTPEGRTRRIVAPVALLRDGHSALFTWILTRAPQETLDQGSSKTVARLQTRGLIR